MPSLPRAYVIELIGTFALVYVSAGVVCINQMTTPAEGSVAALSVHQPGLIGVALAQGLTFAALLAVTVPYSGGYLNPAIAIMLWCFNRLNSTRAWWLIGAQVMGAVLAALCLRLSFTEEITRSAGLGAPHLNPLAYHTHNYAALLAGTAVELILTFFLVFAIFGVLSDPRDQARHAALAGGAMLTAAVLFGFALTGAALNPARWFGPVFVEALGSRRSGSWSDALVYLAGPTLGALLGGLASFRLLRPVSLERSQDTGKMQAGGKH